jgi:hypothetical protein
MISVVIAWGVSVLFSIIASPVDVAAGIMASEAASVIIAWVCIMASPVGVASLIPAVGLVVPWVEQTAAANNTTSTNRKLFLNIFTSLLKLLCKLCSNTLCNYRVVAHARLTPAILNG